MRKFKIANKKASISFSAKKIVNLVIAAICIVLLLYLGFLLMSYNSSLKKQAKANLENILEISKNLKDGESKSYMITNPQNWHLMFFLKDDIKPLNCNGKDCLCICEDVSTFKDCSGTGVCLPSEKFEIVGSSTISLVDLPFSIYLSKKNSIIEIRNSRNLFAEQLCEGIMKFKIDENSLTVLDLFKQYINSNDLNLRNKLVENINLFIKDKEVVFLLEFGKRGKESLILASKNMDKLGNYAERPDYKFTMEDSQKNKYDISCMAIKI